MVYNQIFGVKLEYGIHNTAKQVDVACAYVYHIFLLTNKTHNDYIICVCFHVNRAVLFPHMIYYSTKYFRKL